MLLSQVPGAYSGTQSLHRCCRLHSTLETLLNGPNAQNLPQLQLLNPHLFSLKASTLWICFISHISALATTTSNLTALGHLFSHPTLASCSLSSSNFLVLR